MPKKLVIHAKLHTNTRQSDNRERVILVNADRDGDGLELLLQTYDKQEIFPNGVGQERYEVTIRLLEP